MLSFARTVAERRGARFALVFLPHPLEGVAGRYRLDISSLDSIDVLSNFPSDPAEAERIHFPSDRHWNERGHALAARALIGALSREGVLDDSSLRGH